jgi:hypothetical protein
MLTEFERNLLNIGLQKYRPGQSKPIRASVGSTGLFLARRRFYREKMIRPTLSSKSSATTIKRQPHPQHEACMFFSRPNSGRIAGTGPPRFGLIAS